ncbi:MAG: tRNA epoxyqueuosine(34) reductase QueG [Spirochaetales bacterium]
MIPREPFYPQVDDDLSELARSHDLELLGVAPVEAAPLREAEYREFIAKGHHGEMTYLARNEHLKYRPTEVLAGTRSVIVFGLNYYQEAAAGATSGVSSGRVARYAWGRDYHNAFGKRLKRIVKQLRERYPAEDFRSFVDASPLAERYLAERGGIAYTARNTLSISSAYGSWFFIGEILSTLPFAPTPAETPVHGGCPSGCFRCGAACPTDALYDHYRIDARRCISYLTIEHRGSIPEELRPLMQDWVFGCDLCQEVCPLNVRARETTLPDFTAHRAGGRLSLERLLVIKDQLEYRSMFCGTPLLRPGRDAMVRNACIAAANTGANALLPQLRVLAHDASALVREHARWAIAVLEGPATGTALEIR